MEFVLFFLFSSSSSFRAAVVTAAADAGASANKGADAHYQEARPRREFDCTFGIYEVFFSSSMYTGVRKTSGIAAGFIGYSFSKNWFFVCLVMVSYMYIRFFLFVH